MAGFYEGDDLANKTFYGFRMNPDDGNLNVEIIKDGSVVALPQDNILDKYNYQKWLWTQDTLQFQWGSNGHLQVKIV